MTILIVDDSPNDRKMLRKDLIKLGENEKGILEATNEAEFLKILHSERPEIVFLDINLGKEHAFDILDRMGAREFEIIFTTAHSEYAVDSYKYSAVGYLTKPTSQDRLTNALRKVKNNIEEKIRNKRHETLLYNISDFPKFEQRIMLSNKDAIHHKRLNEIIYIHSDHPICNFYFQDGRRITVNNSLKYYEEHLEDFHFFRTHNRYIVNLFFVESYVWAEDAVKLSDGKTLVPVARDRKDNFFVALSKLSIK